MRKHERAASRNTAKYKDILKVLAPCGLNCTKCFAFAEGEIKALSEGLEERLGSFDRYAERFTKFIPVFANYPPFKELLAHLASGDCFGCRKQTCKFPNCGVAVCYRTKKVDFCFQCDEFPCDKTNFDPDLKRRWVEMNERMRAVGVEAFFEETKNLPRYR